MFVLSFSYLQGEKISTILKAANVDVEPYWPGLFAKALEGINVKDLISNIGSGVGAAPAAAPAAAAAGAPVAAAAEKKVEKEESEEEDDDMGFGKFQMIDSVCSMQPHYVIYNKQLRHVNTFQKCHMLAIISFLTCQYNNVHRFIGCAEQKWNDVIIVWRVAVDLFVCFLCWRDKQRVFDDPYSTTAQLSTFI